MFSGLDITNAAVAKFLAQIMLHLLNLNGFRQTFTSGGAMEAIQGLGKSLVNSVISGLVRTKSESTKAIGEFDATLKALISPTDGTKVSEEDLFSALVQERIKKTKGEGALTEFKTIFESAKNRLRKADGYVPVEDATKAALKEFRDTNKISKDEADSIYSQAFAGAQLDQNTNALYDGRGGPGDPTIAVAEMEQALLLSGAIIGKYDAGSETAALRSLDEASNAATSSTGAGPAHSSETGNTGFLFKPVSDSDGRLAILLPPNLAGQVQSVSLVGPNGEIIESGRYSGNGNGGRDHYRFTKPGGQYPDGLTVLATLANGDLIRYIINKTSERNENVQPATQGGPGSNSGQSTLSL